MYSPKVDEDLIPSLYWLAKARGIPMTHLVNGNLRAMLDTMDVQRELAAVRRGHITPRDEVIVGEDVA